MFKKLKLRSLRKITERNLRTRDNSQVNAPLKTIGFLVEEAMFQEFEKLYDIWRDLSILSKDVKIFTFIEVKKKTPSLRQNQINNKDITWSGDIHNQNATEFLSQSFDVLVGYYPGKHEYLDMMVSVSNAKFKVGFTGADERLFDLLITINPLEVDRFKVELKKYLEILKKI